MFAVLNPKSLDPSTLDFRYVGQEDSALTDVGLTEFIQIIVGILFDLLAGTKPVSD